MAPLRLLRWPFQFPQFHRNTTSWNGYIYAFIILSCSFLSSIQIRLAHPKYISCVCLHTKDIFESLFSFYYLMPLILSIIVSLWLYLSTIISLQKDRPFDTLLSSFRMYTVYHYTIKKWLILYPKTNIICKRFISKAHKYYSQLV